MMEIKVRAWDEEKNRMYSGDEIEEYDDLNAWLSYGSLVIYRIEDGEYTELKPIQFTGLHDKNGKEIYESDIILKTDTGSKFEVYYSENSACYRVKRQDGWHFDLSDIFPVDEWEIIGNVYEAITITCVRSTGLKA